MCSKRWRLAPTPWNWAGLLEIVHEELVQAAASAGRATLKSIDRTAVKVNFV
jgi:hypothetical protein